MALESRRHWWQALTQNIVRLALAVATVLLVANLIRSVQRNYQVSQQIRELRHQIETEQDRIEIVKQENSYYRTQTFRELELRRRLGFALPGETLVLAPENRDPKEGEVGVSIEAATNEARTQWESRPTYEQWWLLFFGPQSLLEATFGS